MAVSSPAAAGPPPAPVPQIPAAEQPVPSDEVHSVGHQLLLYIPNRIFDVLDLVLGVLFKDIRSDDL